MLARQTRTAILAHHASALRTLARPTRCTILQNAASALGRRCVVTQQRRPLRRQASDAGNGLTHERTLATAVDDLSFGNAPYSNMEASTLPPLPASYYGPRAIDPSAPVTIPEPNPRAPPTKTNTAGIPGEVDEMLPLFDACIRVGALERAAMVLKRVNNTGVVTGEERILLHNQYLRASLEQIKASPDRKQAEKLHKWYELQIRSQDMPQTAETIACMLKASLLSERGERLARLVNRYMSLAPGEAGLRVLSMADILSDQDLAVITEICPTYNFTPDLDEIEAAEYASGDPDAIPFETSEGTTQAAQSESFPELVETPQKGQGLASLKSSLGLMQELEHINISRLSLEEQREFQIRLERDSIDAAIRKWRVVDENMQSMGIITAINPSGDASSLSQHLPEWFSAMEARLKVEAAKIEESEKKVSKSEEDMERCIYGPFIRQSSPSRLAAVTILSVLNHGSIAGVDRGVVISRLISDIARVAQEDFHLQEKEKAEKASKSKSRRKVAFTGTVEERAAGSEPIIADALEPEVEREEPRPKRWSTAIKAHVGSILLKSLVETAKIKVVKEHPVSKELISQYQPAFSHMQSPRRGRKVGVLILNSELIEKMKMEPPGDFLAKHLPMVVEPQPWVRMNRGGFLDSKTSLVRFKPGDVEQKLYTKAAIKRGDMEQVFKGLDVLGKTAWQINKDVLGVLMEAWNTGEELANMPPLNPNLEIPAEPDSSADPVIRRHWIRAVKAIENERSALHSQRCFMNLQLEIARAFRNQTIYFPHNVDYRGRAYPMPTYLNHMGADHTRAVLKFAKGKELGVSGLRWLKVHLSNVYGFDKASFEEREAFATQNLPNIIESATNPLKGSRWWLKAEDPWQCLAACFELKAAHELDDPTKFLCQLPVHQDGTCNGLQHYAALGGDTWGAKQVNLEPGSRPADVYSAVANLVKEGIAKDLAAGNRLAEIVTGKITRKVVKQTVMTNVYGVTFAGAKKQVCKQIDALYPNLFKECGVPHVIISTYIAKHIFTSLATMFRGAHDIQYWLGESGGRVCRALTPAQLDQIAETFDEGDKVPKKRTKKAAAPSKNGLDEFIQQFRSTVVWTTPLRMPVAQPYRKATMKEVKTCMQSIVFPANDQTDPVNRRKQLQGFPPNFIHSLDASHMILSALNCSKAGLEFAAVHDSFWTHAADVDVMNTILREAFIQIHEEDVVGRLAAEFEARYKGSLYLAHIDADTPVAKKIKELRKNSKLSQKEELLLEHKRNTMKLSENPWDREAAKQIVTPAAVYEEMSASEQDVVIKEETEEIGLGAIPEGEAKTDDAALVEEAQSEMEEVDAEVEDMATQESTEFSEELLEHVKCTRFEQVIIDQKKKKSVKSKKAPLPVWLPLTFPPVPQKGEFDVKRLRESKYFFS